MNKKLVTSWTNVLMVLALCVIAYNMFKGLCFYSKGDFGLAGTVTAIGVLTVGIFFFLPQQLKGSDLYFVNFNNKIWIERFLIFLLAPMSLIIVMFPISHYLNIQKHEQEIVQEFSCAIDTARTMFSDYKLYADKRMQEYSYCIRNAGEMERQNKMRALRLNLLSSNYNLLHTSAIEWIENSIHEPSAGDVFLLGNIKGIKQAIESWNKQLVQLSEKKLSDESDGVVTFHLYSSGATAAFDKLNSLELLYTQLDANRMLDYSNLLCFVVLWFFLLFPYLRQKRHSKDTNSLFSSNRIDENQFMFYWEK